MTTDKTKVQATPARILEGFAETFGRTAAGIPRLKLPEQIDAMTGLVENIGKLAETNPDMGGKVVETLRICAKNPALRQESLLPVVHAIEARLAPLVLKI
jgi:hypothetical protein